MYKYILIYLSLTVILNGDIFIVYSNNLDLKSISKEEMSRLYLKKNTKIKNKDIVVLNNLDCYDEFNKKILNKTPSEVHAYWMKQIFLGRKVPPKKVKNQNILDITSSEDNFIGYTNIKPKGDNIYEVK